MMMMLVSLAVANLAGTNYSCFSFSSETFTVKLAKEFLGKLEQRENFYFYSVERQKSNLDVRKLSQVRVHGDQTLVCEALVVV